MLPLESGLPYVALQMATFAGLVLSSAGLVGQGSGTDSRDPDQRGTDSHVNPAWVCLDHRYLPFKW